MKNVAFTIEKDTLVIRVNLKETQGKSKSEKNEIIGTTGGNVDVGKDGIKFGLNVYKPATAKK
jgi:hypothetical protein